MRDEAKNRDGMWDTRNFKGGMQDENRTTRPGSASLRDMLQSDIEKYLFAS